MKHIRVVLLVAAILAAARLAGAQVLNQDVGVPLGTAWNPGTPIVIINEAGTEDQVTPIGDPAFFAPAGISTALPGDLIFTNANNPGGDAPSNWLADIRFFNPLDPNGSLGLPATETEAFYPEDLGPGEFNSFQLMPYYNFLPVSSAPGLTEFADTEVLFGPAGGILPGQQGIVIFFAYPGEPAGTPEPGGVALLFGVGAVGAGLLVRRRCERSHIR